jgi:hypothetical protein
MARLVVNPGSPVAWDIPLKPGINLIGRGFSNDYKIADPSVSGSHCQISLTGQTAVLRDLGSTNGTFVNRAPVQEAVLQNGQTIHLGGVEMVFYSEPTVQQPVPTALPVGQIIPTPPPPTASPTGPSAPGWQPIGTQAPPLAVPVSLQPAALAQPIGAQAPALGQLLSAETERIARPAAVPAPPAPRFTVAPSVRSGTAAPPAMAAPPAIRTAAAPSVVTGPQRCKFHPKTFARFVCNKCHHAFCDLCITSRTVGGVQHKTCRQCGSELVTLNVRIEKSAEIGFYRRLGSAFGYPFRGSGFFLMLVGIVLFTGLKYGRVMMFAGGLRPLFMGIGLQVFAGGYLFTFLQAIIHATAAEDKEMPDLPSMSNMADDILLPFCRLLGLFIICFGIAIPLAIWVSPIAGMAAAVFGGLYFPMAFLAVAILDSVAAANPLVVVPSILKVPLEYGITVLLLGASYALRPLGDDIIGAAFPRGLLSHSMAEMFAYLAANAFWGFFNFYTMIVAVHILGLLYVSKKDKLGWLDR